MSFGSGSKEESESTSTEPSNRGKKAGGPGGNDPTTTIEERAHT
jgi:hypothetical protein